MSFYLAVAGQNKTGDASVYATAGAVLALAGGATLPETALVGNFVASIPVQQLATAGTARPDQSLPRLERWRAWFR